MPYAATIDIGRVTRLADSFAASRSHSARQEYLGLTARASDCTQCGECLQRCPFGVDIISNMERAVEIFGT